MEDRQAFVQAALEGRLGPSDVPTLIRALREGWAGGELHRAACVFLGRNFPQPQDVVSDPLLATILVLGTVTDAGLEGRLTTVRRTLLFSSLDDTLAPLAARIAAQGFINEYAWLVTPEEQAAVERLKALPRTAETLLKLGAYLPLNSLPDGRHLLSQTWPETTLAVLRYQVAAPLREAELAASLPTLTPIRSGVSQAVQAMYEANPYPRWEKAPPVSPVVLDLPANPSVLVCGCGTGRQALNAAGRYPNADILAVDLSRASLGYAARKVTEAGVPNVTLAQADLLELPSLGRSFDVIECSGVLHHLENPSEGAAVLTSMLNPGGWMRLGLYSAAARAPLKPAQALAKRFAPDPDGIRALRAAIYRLAPDSPVRYATAFNDFYSTSMCRDLLMHVQETWLTIPKIARLLSENGLEFKEFLLSREPKGAPARTDLTAWKAYERAHPTTFTGMYQFWARKP